MSRPADETNGGRVAALTRRPELIPGLLGVASFIILAASGGGYRVTGWAPAGLFMLGLLLAAAYTYRRRLGALEPANRIAMLFLAAFVLWSFASIAWAEVQGTAWDGANLALVYLIVYALFSIVSWRADSAAIVLGLYAVALSVVGAVVLLDAAGSPDAALSLIKGRLAEPTGYPNAVAALFIGGFWPAIHLASRREVPWPLRGLLLAVAGFLVQLAMMPQSRAALLVIPFALLFYLLIAPNRIRAVLFLALAAAATALVAAPILDVFAITDDGGDVGAAIADAGNAMLLSFIGLLLVGTAVAFADRRLEISERTTRAASRAGAVIAAVAAVVAVIVAVAAIGNPVDWAGDRWQDFKGDYDEGGFGSSRFSGDLGSGRYDFWNVALGDEFTGAPVLGQGADNFAVTYLEHRDTTEEPFYPHSLPIRVLAGTGIVGALLFLGFVVAAAVAAFRRRARAPDPLARAVAAVALAAAAYFSLHASGDWLWTFAAITMPVFAWLGIAGGGLRSRDWTEDAVAPVARRLLPRPATVALAVAAAAVLLVAVVSLALPWVSARLTDSAASDWPSDPEAALSRLETARDLNPLSARPDLVAGTIAVRDGDEKEAAAAFARAAEREPTNWYALLELGTLDIVDGQRPQGILQLRRAAKLNPTEPLIATALRRSHSGDPLTSRAIDRILVERVCSRVGPTHGTRYCTN
ncbi:MAG TPA: O-antigen ligase family protein [Solirubrobacterales bacterium]|nr:O-antigen ligase family protein [Solirubrobacterales bacterium]